MFTPDEAKELRAGFWKAFEKYSRKLPEIKNPRNPYLLNKTGINHIDLKFDVERNSIKVAIEVNHKNSDRRLDVYEYLEAFKVILEEGFEKLEWDFAYMRENQQEVCRAYVQLDGYDYMNPNHWETIHCFMAENMIRLQENFLEIRDTLKHQIALI